jgi:NAD-dependent deacetylase
MGKEGDPLLEAAETVRGARHLTAFTGAGISVESGIPPFRGPDGLGNRHDPRMLELSYFRRHPRECWEARGLLKTVITQNIDSV